MVRTYSKGIDVVEEEFGKESAIYLIHPEHEGWIQREDMQHRGGWIFILKIIATSKEF